MQERKRESAWTSKVGECTYYALLVTLFSHILVVALLCFTPPITRDALIHHLAIPKLWLKHGGFCETPWAQYSYYPMNIDLLYLVSLYFKNDIIPKFIHFAFGVATGLLVYLYMKFRFNRNWGLLGALIFLTTPIVVRLSASAYVDLGLVFFTTAAIFAFVKWRDDNYSKLSWLIISGVCMGLAAGSKYNALIAWIFLNLMIVFYYARDTRKELSALKYGVTFFAVAFLIASPWYIKNYVLTSNPLYPVFDNVFNASSHAPGTNGSTGVGLFQKREIMYGESFWETLLIPVRMFFQGQDHSDRYFDGVLNPILIIMPPFAFFSKRFYRDNVFFVSFSSFFLITALFLSAPRVRYILPTIPFLTIMAVTGIKSLVDRSNRNKGLPRRVILTGTFVITTIFVGCNALYLKQYFNAIQPVRYILNQETKDEFLARHVGSYPTVHYINENLPTNAKIFLVFFAGRGYYLDRAYYHEPSFGMKAVKEMVKAARSESEFLICLKSLEASHILMRTSLFKKYLRDNFEQQAIARFLNLTTRYLKRIYESNGYAVYELPKASSLWSRSVLTSGTLLHKKTFDPFLDS